MTLAYDEEGGAAHEGEPGELRDGGLDPDNLVERRDLVAKLEQILLRLLVLDRLGAVDLQEQQILHAHEEAAIGALTGLVPALGRVADAMIQRPEHHTDDDEDADGHGRGPRREREQADPDEKQRGQRDGQRLHRHDDRRECGDAVVVQRDDVAAVRATAEDRPSHDAGALQVPRLLERYVLEVGLGPLQQRLRASDQEHDGEHGLQAELRRPARQRRSRRHPQRNEQELERVGERELDDEE